MSEQVTERKLTIKDLNTSYFMFEVFAQACCSYERLQAPGFFSGMKNVIAKLYTDPEERAEACQRHMEFYNSEFALVGPVILGLTIAMEEEKACGAEIDGLAISAVKTSLMGPLVGIGDTLRQGTLIPIIGSSIAMSIPLVLASVGGAFSVRSGIMALGLESMMMMGAFFGVLGSYFTGSVLFGFLLGMVGGMVIGLFHGILSVRYKVNQVISGIGLNLLALAVTTLLMQLIWNNKGSTPQVASISTTLDFFAPIPVIGPILAQQSVSFLVMVAVVIVGWIVLFKTRFGLRLRMVGENPKAAATMGLRVHGIKYCGVLICGALAGVGGAYLSLDQLDMFVRNMTAGRGYIAVAIAILGRYNPAQIVPCALLFGFCDAVQIYLQGEAFPPQIVQMLPYIVTLLVLAFGVKHIKPPAGVGKYDDE